MSTDASRNCGIIASPPTSMSRWHGVDVLVLSPTPTFPIDAGNRRRVFFVTDALRALGARITFAHYPAEGGWREEIPEGAIAAMSRQWHEVYTIPVTRGLHEASREEDHRIDEWWDPAVGEMIAWLFRTHRFSVFLINYIWLSKAFEFCPPGVLKILDTHDRLSDRRMLLARHGIGPEFFHVTIEEERIALDRADVVWSIKSGEAAFFRSLTDRMVVNIPHVEPLDVVRTCRPRNEVLRFGMAGAKNSINAINFRAFMAETDAYIRETLLPCDFVIAGSVCEILEDLNYSWLRQLGRLTDMADFYDEVDVVLAPISFSTGLKVKVGEALCKGKAVVALDHAFEGYLPRHPFHTLSSMRKMLQACRQIVNDPALIDELEDASLQSVLQTQSDVSQGLQATILERWRLKPGICIVVSIRDIHPGSLVVDHVREVARFLGNLATVAVFVEGKPEKLDVETLRAVAEVGVLVTTPELYARLEPLASKTTEWDAIRVSTCLEMARAQHIAFWFASCPGDWPAALRQQGRAYIACDSLLQSSTMEELGRFVASAQAIFADVVMLSGRGVPDAALQVATGRHHRLPLLRYGEASLNIGRIRGRAAERVVVLADDAEDPLVQLIVTLTLRRCARHVYVVLPDRDFGSTGSRRENPADVAGLHIASAAQYLSPSDMDETGVFLVFDLGIDPAWDGLREMFDVALVPRATLFVREADPTYDNERENAGARGVFESVMLVEKLLTCPASAAALRTQRATRESRANDAGWASIWAEIGALIQQASASKRAIGCQQAVGSDTS